MPYTYMLECSDGKFYTGWTVDLVKRVDDHNAGKGAKFTRARLPVNLIYWEEQVTRSEAQKREYVVRNLKRKEKELLLEKFRQESEHANKNHDKTP
ncbi:MAG: GIY-YIG nuclease family protein [Clostridiales bacterium]|nr:GIY-YIG nuclease family protein [Clostridiales bacterium]